MTNKEIAKTFSELADLMEIHEENEFKVKSYRNAYISIRRFPGIIEEMEPEALMGQRGLGRGVVAKIEELLDYERIEDLEVLREKTPKGIRDMLSVKGLGPKKIKIIWHQLGIEDIPSLIYACNENRLVEAKGFGVKTQTDLLERSEFFMATRDKHLYSSAASFAEQIKSQLSSMGIQAIESGELLRKCEVIDEIELVCHGKLGDFDVPGNFSVISSEDNMMRLQTEHGVEFSLIFNTEDPASILLERSIVANSVEDIEIINNSWTTSEWFLPPPEFWDNAKLMSHPETHDEVVTQSDIKGVIHNHSVYSDGSHTIEQMADACRARGYEYMVISDHSKSAFYAGGLDEDRIMRQWEEIDVLNHRYQDFKIFKSIESDILYDGSLDYDDDLLEGFDLVIASIHSQLKMDEAKAMERLTAAVRHPATKILGHPTGRLLLGRQGYPVDHKTLIEVCAESSVVIELNANPQRLDMDWRWIGYAQELGVMISINPDAHHIDGIDDIKYGVAAARKGGLLKANCLCAKSRIEFEEWIG